jgi:hypothetical protein
MICNAEQFLSCFGKSSSELESSAGAFATPAWLTHAPSLKRRIIGEFLETAPNCAHGDPGDLSNRSDPAKTRRLRLCRCKQTLLPLTQIRCQGFEPPTNTIPIDHQAKIGDENESVNPKKTKAKRSLLIPDGR